jgi:hypothetical protein
MKVSAKNLSLPNQAFKVRIHALTCLFIEVLIQCRSWWLLNFKTHVARLPLDAAALSVIFDRLIEQRNLST